MFSEDEIKEVPEKIAKLFKDLEKDVMDDIVKRISKTNEISRTADWELYRVNQLSTSGKDLKKKLKKSLEYTDEQMNRLYDEIIAKGYAHDESLYKAMNVPFIPLNENKELKQLIGAIKEQTNGEFENITRTTGFVVNNGNKEQILTDYYKSLLDKATVEIATGTFNYDSTLKKVVNEMANSGLRTIDYDSGHADRIDVAARRAVMTGLRQVTGKISEDNAKALNTEYFEVSAHITARPSHALWQGKVYTKEQLTTICGLGTVTGLCGVNCYHMYDPFIYGVSVRRYSDDDLSKMYQDTLTEKEYKGKKYTPYEATQRQRALERRMRTQDEKIRLLKSGGASREDIHEVKLRREATYQEYKEFSKKMGLPEQMNRVFNSERKSAIATPISSPIETAKTDYKTLATSSFANLTNRQKAIDEKINDVGSLYSFKKKDIKMSDLISLTAINGCEYAMFTKGSERIIIRGTRYSTSDGATLISLAKQGYRWSGHTHPFNDWPAPSNGDIETLKLFKNKKKIVYNSFGKATVFNDKGEFVKGW